ncbi:MAG: bifunctional enoyl-CoA hydratase/phosphate acetyltransferase [Candidatus Mcinerneyibacterium aminivorans]|uniref:Bifunctional enoyl-CoA hydratase/phosphate acetyltransferase n=1 Tax=Candidatus Mcinerneyibacterium aminivorans TaxID=2703815 RepID=A0A5D0MKJ2_9BACT|nr:MAG: bifunctional enoyl-CoA hydratase/phosphate acetyltransferase [Candidatus Mcinerneyibacterium aminivorans]
MNFKDLYKEVKSKKRVVSVVCPYGGQVMTALENARKKNIADSILVGKKEKIETSINEIGANVDDYKIVNASSDKEAARKGVSFVANQKADAIMKGKIQTATFMRAVLDKENGLRKGSILSHITAYEAKKYHKLLFITDGGIVIEPDLSEKIKILENAINYVRRLGIKKPKVAVMAHREAVDEKVKATTDAAKLAKMNDRGQIKNAFVDGPFAFDNAISKEAAEIKGIKSEVAGDADVLLVPDVVSGNLMAKAVMYMADCKFGGVVVGAKAPIILLSRADDAETKLNSIVMGLL